MFSSNQNHIFQIFGNVNRANLTLLILWFHMERPAAFQAVSNNHPHGCVSIQSLAVILLASNFESLKHSVIIWGQVGTKGLIFSPRSQLQYSSKDGQTELKVAQMLQC